MKTILLVTAALILSSCSHLDTSRKKILASTIGGAVLGTLAGPSFAPEGDNKGAWTVLGGSSGAALGATLGTLLFADNIEMRKLEEERAAMAIQLKQYQDQFDPKLVEQGSSLMQSPLPEDARKLIRPGSWKKYKLDRWVQDTMNQNIYLRQTEMYEFVPPTTGE